MRSSSFLCTCAAAMLSAATGALAGGYVAPVGEPVVVAPVVAETPDEDWAGGYAGGSLGYSFGGDDVIGLDIFEDDTLIQRNKDLGSVDVKGATVGLHAGYRWQRGNWVFGPELWIEGGGVDASDTVTLGGEAEVESAVNYLAGLQFKTGYAIDARTLVYGTAGAVYGDFDYSLSTAGLSDTVTYDASGYTLGLGAERMLRDNVAIFAEWQYRNFGKTDVDFGTDANSIRGIATPEHHNVRIGVNFSF